MSERLQILICLFISEADEVFFSAATYEERSCYHIHDLSVIAEHCTVSCHARSWEDGLLDRLIEAVGTITKNAAEMFGGTGVMTVSGKTPVLVQDPGVTSRLRKAAEEIYTAL